MKDFLEYIKESHYSNVQPVIEAKGEDIIVFNTKGALAIYCCELQGQVSDGYWENSRPHDHWKWVADTVPVYDKNADNGHTGSHRIRYSCKWLATYVRKALKNTNSDVDWAIRVFNYGKFGTILPDNKVNEFIENSDYLRSVIEELPEEKPEDFDKWLEEYSEKYSFRKKYADKFKEFGGDKLIDAYYDLKYTLAEFLNDLDAAEEAMNTYKENGQA